MYALSEFQLKIEVKKNVEFSIPLDVRLLRDRIRRKYAYSMHFALIAKLIETGHAWLALGELIPLIYEIFPDEDRDLYAQCYAAGLIAIHKLKNEQEVLTLMRCAVRFADVLKRTSASGRESYSANITSCNFQFRPICIVRAEVRLSYFAIRPQNSIQL